MVLIRHECGAQSHWDWMLCPADAPSNPDSCVLESWRAWAPLHRGVPLGGLDIEQSAPHRLGYLKLDAPKELSDGRGRVETAACGLWRPAEPPAAPGMAGIEVRWDGGWSGLLTLGASPRGPSWRRLTACPHRGS